MSVHTKSELSTVIGLGMCVCGHEAWVGKPRHLFGFIPFGRYAECQHCHRKVIMGDYVTIPIMKGGAR